MRKSIMITMLMGLSLSLCYGQSNSKEGKEKKSLHVGVQNGATPDVYVDGKRFDFPMEIIDKDQIATINVIKGDKALNEYNAKNGVIVITTKKASSTKLELSEEETGKDPMVIIDGVVKDREALRDLSPDDIQTIDVIKGEEALIQYKALYGVVKVTTKKGKGN